MVRHTDFARPITQLEYLESRTREETVAAVKATCVEARLMHVALATAYALRFGQESAVQQAAADWVDGHRIW